MRIFDTQDSEVWGKKVNFVDDNNVFVGYDMEKGCCESADWFIADKIAEFMPNKLIHDRNVDGFFFDETFFKELSYIKCEDHDFNALDEWHMIIFRLVKGSEEKFLHIYNCHNGYYGHGFQMKIGDKEIRSGVL